MCGIVAVLQRPVGGAPAHFDGALTSLHSASAVMGSDGSTLSKLRAVQPHLRSTNECLRGRDGVGFLLSSPAVARDVQRVTASLESEVLRIERSLDLADCKMPGDVELVNAAILQVRDLLWAISRDRLKAAQGVGELAGHEAGRAAIAAYCSVYAALSSIERMEVRGRDSAGLHVLVSGHALDAADPEIAQAVASRGRDPLFTSGAVRASGGCLAFVYKAAAEIGELGDNIALLKKAIAGDDLLRRALAAPTAAAAVLGHTRWASVGTISEANAHPLDGCEAARPVSQHVAAALNGDIDNYRALVEQDDLRISDAITTDAKVIPVLLARKMAQDPDAQRTFRETMVQLKGSMAIAASTAAAPTKMFLAVRGSGQALYVGLARDSFIVASEPYGVVEEAPCYIRIDGESTGGQLLTLDAAFAGEPEGINRTGYDGEPIAVAAADCQEAEITTRDVDRRGFRHFLLKEISESPESFRKTLRGRIIETEDGLAVDLGQPEVQTAAAALTDGSLARIIVVGQGTAAIAGQAVAAALMQSLSPLNIPVLPLPATELSGFHLEDDMSDALVIAISQSGTTTDTNRTVDLVKARGATVIAIVNRRSTDLVDKSHAVIYTADGRDLEMSVASTKAFYAQVAAGFLLAEALAREAGCADSKRSSARLTALRELPAAMQQVLQQRSEIAVLAARHACRRRHWAVVGSGVNRVAAAEVRIKLSELCYKSVAYDTIEDKKHIDLSSEPLILVCAAGLEGPNAEDAAKDVAIYRAHKAAPIVIATKGTTAFGDVETIEVPAVDPCLAMVVSAMAGHLFGYEAALAIDAAARPLREIRAAIQELALTAGPGMILGELAGRISSPARQFLTTLSGGGCDGCLSPGLAVGLSTLLRCAIGELPVEFYEREKGELIGPAAFVDDLVEALSRAIDELTRPIDSVKHQAKTVTVGISRSEDELFAAPLVRAVIAAGARPQSFGYRALRTLAVLGPAVEEVTGFTRYAISGDLPDASVSVVSKGGIASNMKSRAETDSTLRGTKRRTVESGEVEVSVGASDGRPVVLVPERKGRAASGLTLLHVRFAARLEPAVARQVLLGYRAERYEALVAAVTETQASFDERLLGDLSIPELLVEPVLTIASRWRTAAESSTAFSAS